MPHPAHAKLAAVLAATLLLAACGKQDNDPGPGGVSVGEARALDEAAEMVESRRLPDDLAQPAAAQPGAAPAGKPAERP